MDPIPGPGAEVIHEGHSGLVVFLTGTVVEAAVASMTLCVLPASTRKTSLIGGAVYQSAESLVSGLEPTMFILRESDPFWRGRSYDPALADGESVVESVAHSSKFSLTECEMSAFNLKRTTDR